MTTLSLRIGERQRQCIGGIGGRRIGQMQHPLDHLGDSELLRGTVSHNGLLHLARRDFINLESCLRRRDQARAAGFAHDERRLQILRVKKSLDHAHSRVLLADDLTQRQRNHGKTTRAFPARGTTNRAMNERLRMRLRNTNDPETGPAQRWIDSQNDSLRMDGTMAALEHGCRDVRAGPEPFLHLLELLRADGHAGIVPNDFRLQRKLFEQLR